MTDPILHHDLVVPPGASPGNWLYVLHGIFGAGRNWASVMRRVVRERPDWGAVLVDLREHGRSTGFAPPHTLAAVAADVDRLAGVLGRPAAALLGHSFGGKVALVFARDHGLREGTRQLWIVDSLPAAAPVPRGAAWGMLAILRRHPGPFGTRADAVAALEAEGLSTGVAQWFSTNLRPAPDRLLHWRIDLPAMEAMLRDFFATDLWDLVEHPPDALHIHFVRAEGSDVMPDAVARRIERIGRGNGRVRLHPVAGGHWLNADNPQAVEVLLVRDL